MLPVAVAAGALLVALVSGCDESSESPDEADGLRRYVPTTRSIVRICEDLRRVTSLDVYCPPVIPPGEVTIQENGTFADENSYAISALSPVLGGPDPVHAGHWVVFAGRPAAVIRPQVDNGFRNRARNISTKPERFAAAGVNGVLLRGARAGSGLMSRDHVIAYWRHNGIGYIVSVHYQDEADTARHMARAIMEEIAKCEDADESLQRCPDA